MSGTKSASPMAPATNASPPAALIVAHGQPSDPATAEAALRVLAGHVNARLPDWAIGSATMAEKGALQRARQQHPAAPIYPLFMADGWFTGTALPGRLNPRDQSQMLPPLGLDQRLPQLAIDLLKATLVAKGWDMSDTCLVIAGHGGKTSKNPAKATQKFSAALAEISCFSDIRVGFLEEEPALSKVTIGLGKKAICLPFFAANGRHVREDIPADLKAAGYQGVVLDAIGHNSQIPDLIAKTLLQTHRQSARAS